MSVPSPLPADHPIRRLPRRKPVARALARYLGYKCHPKHPEEILIDESIIGRFEFSENFSLLPGTLDAGIERALQIDGAEEDAAEYAIKESIPTDLTIIGYIPGEPLDKGYIVEDEDPCPSCHQIQLIRHYNAPRVTCTECKETTHRYIFTY